MIIELFFVSTLILSVFSGSNSVIIGFSQKIGFSTDDKTDIEKDTVTIFHPPGYYDAQTSDNLPLLSATYQCPSSQSFTKIRIATYVSSTSSISSLLEQDPVFQSDEIVLNCFGSSNTTFYFSQPPYQFTGTDFYIWYAIWSKVDVEFYSAPNYNEVKSYTSLTYSATGDFPAYSNTVGWDSNFSKKIPKIYLLLVNYSPETCPPTCSNNGVCNNIGECNCDEGFYDDICSTSYVCTEICINGACNISQVCQCERGFAGDDCSRILYDCNPKCKNGGYCNSSLICECPQNYHGEDCGLTCSVDCLNGGVCNSSLICGCAEGYISENCGDFLCYGISKDDDNVCNSNGICDLPNGCTCSWWYAGEICKKTIVEVYGIYFGTFLGVAGVVLLIVIVFSVCCVCTCALKRIKAKRDLLTYGMELEDEEDSEFAKFTIDQSAFKIKYESVKLISLVGKGGSDASVFKSEWNGVEVAFKIFKFRYFSSQDDLDEFARVGIVLEFCSNGDVISYIKKQRGSFSLKEKIRILKQICQGMEYLHEKGITHRDLKNDNCLLNKSVDVKLIDFGLAKKLRENAKKTERIGTVYYMAPEVFLGLDYDSRIDVYAFGILLFEILEETNEPYGKDIFGIEGKIANANLRPKMKYEGKYPKWLVSLMKCSWTNNPARRKSFTEIIRIINDNTAV